MNKYLDTFKEQILAHQESILVVVAQILLIVVLFFVAWWIFNRVMKPE